MKYSLAFFLLFPFFLNAQSPDSLQAQHIAQLLAKAIALEEQQQFQAMLDTAELACALGYQYFGAEGLPFADAMQMKGVALTNVGQFAIADSLLGAARKIYVKVVGKTHPKYANNLFQQSTFYYLTKNVQDGIPTLLETLDLHEQLFGKIHLSYAICKALLGSLYLIDSQYKAAEKTLLESRDITERLFGNSSDEYASTLHYLTQLYNRMGRFTTAEPIILEMLSIKKKTVGTAHISYAVGLENLATLYYRTGRYQPAIAAYQQVLNIVADALGQAHPMYGSVLNNLALTHLEFGQLEQAERQYLEALQLMEKVQGTETLDYGTTYYNLANLYLKMGRYKAAEKLIRGALEIHEKVLGQAHWKYPQLQANLANTYYHLERYKEAEALYLATKANQEKVLGTENFDYALTLNNLGNLYVTLEQYERADSLFQQAQKIYLATNGSNTLPYANLLKSMAQESQRTKNFAAAKNLLHQAKSIQEDLIGAQDISVAQTLEQLAQLALAQQQTATAADYMMRSLQIGRQLQAQRATHFSNAELAAYQSLFQTTDDLLHHINQRLSSPLLLQAAYDHLLFQKGFLLENTLKRERLVAQASPEWQEKHQHWKGYQRRLALEYSKTMEERNPTILELESQARLLEKALTQGIVGFDHTPQSIDWASVQAQLPPQSIAIEFLHYTDQQEQVQYAALLLSAQAPAPRFVSLGTEASLEAALRLGPAAYAVQQDGSSLLTELLWHPLAEALAGVQRIYFAPAGLLHRVHWGGVAINDSTVLADRFALLQLGSTRQLVEPQAGSVETAKAVLFGGLDYGQATTAASSASSWKSLTWTEVEVMGISDILAEHGIATQLQTGDQGSEAALKSLGREAAAPPILHLATHGYFYPAPATRTALSEAATAFQASRHPMIRSGLILANANPAWTGQAVPPGTEDGILTAYEISQLDLSNTELVVLSACDTGLGDIARHEGVYGLQRAFKIAGARYVLMSLWQISDFQTQELMTSFYWHWLDKKQSIPAAFQAAQAVMRQRYPDPQFWAGFVLVE